MLIAILRRDDHLASDLNSSHTGTIATRCRIKLS
jgi:hypothetical protein